MRIPLLSLLVVGGTVLTAAVLPAAQTASLAGPTGAQIHPNEPVLIYDITGFTFAGGQRHTNLVVFNSGVASFSRSDTIPIVEHADLAFTGTEAVAQLRTELLQAGAATLFDQNLTGNDTPLMTVTILRGATEARAHTYSYYVASGAYGVVQGIIDAFIAEHFPGGGAGTTR